MYYVDGFRQAEIAEELGKTQVFSVFDLMYDDYAPILEKTKKELLNIFFCKRKYNCDGDR